MMTAKERDILVDCVVSRYGYNAHMETHEGEIIDFRATPIDVDGVIEKLPTVYGQFGANGVTHLRVNTSGYGGMGLDELDQVIDGLQVAANMIRSLNPILFNIKVEGSSRLG
jgi:hypothetical protein